MFIPNTQTGGHGRWVGALSVSLLAEIRQTAPSAVSQMIVLLKGGCFF